MTPDALSESKCRDHADPNLVQRLLLHRECGGLNPLCIGALCRWGGGGDLSCIRDEFRAENQRSSANSDHSSSSIIT
jgi:hypothetical protein